MDAATILLVVAFLLGLAFVGVRLRRSGLLSDDSEQRLAAAMAPVVAAPAEGAPRGPALVVLLAGAEPAVADLGERFATRWGRPVALEPRRDRDGVGEPPRGRFVASAGELSATLTAGGLVAEAAGVEHAASLAIAPSNRGAAVDRIRFAAQLALARVAAGGAVALWLPAAESLVPAERLGALVAAGPLHHAALVSLLVTTEAGHDGVRTRGMATFGMPELRLRDTGTGAEALVVEAATQCLRSGRAPRPGESGDLLGDGSSVRVDKGPDGTMVLSRS